MRLKNLKREFTVCKVGSVKNINYDGDFIFIGKTDKEISLVCETKNVPYDVVEREDNWRGFRIEGQLDFSLIGIIAKISDILAKNDVGIFVISTYDTDYVFVKEHNYNKALTVLGDSGYYIED